MKPLVAVLLFIGVFNSGTLHAQQQIDWMSIEDVEAAVAKEPRPVFIDIYTDWCGWCKRMDQSTFIDPDFVDYINKNYYAVKLDGEEKNILTYRGKEFKFVARGRRGYNELPAGFLQGRLSYPTYTILNAELKPLQSFRGFRTAEEFLPIVVFLGEGRYKDTKWDDFLASWESKE